MLMNENMFLDVMGDVNPEYVEEVLFMPQFSQNNRDLERYRKKSNFGRILGSVAACLLIVGVGMSVLILHNNGFFTTPAESTEAVATTEQESKNTAESTENTAAAETTIEEISENTAEETTAPPQTLRLPDGIDGLEGISGDNVVSNITKIEYMEDKPDIWSNIECEGFAYLAQPKGISFNTAENGEMFDEASWFSGNIDTNDSDYEYKRYYVGDKIGDLTVNSAIISFWNMVEENVPDKCRKSMNISFDGTVTLTGYINTYTLEDGFVNSQKERAVYFAPDAEGSKKLPVFKGFNSPTESTLITEYLSDNFSFYGEHTGINLGYSNEFSDFPDNEAVKVKITISNLNYHYAQGGPVSSAAFADLISYEAVG